jgi:mycofactocin precursor peptide peptidase
VTRLADTAWPDVDRLVADGAVLVVPIGACEQHGPHLPVTTDADLALAVADLAADADPLLVVAPVVAYGSSGEHDGFAGTLSIGRAATEHLLVELGRSASATFAQVVFACAHGGNAAPFRSALDYLGAEGRPVTGWWPRWGGDLHAGRTETSLMLAVAPGRVRLGAAAAGDVRPLQDLLPALEARGVRAVSPNGVLGDPTGATADEGRALLDEAAADLVRTAARLRAGAVPVAVGSGGPEVDPRDGLDRRGSGGTP